MFKGGSAVRDLDFGHFRAKINGIFIGRGADDHLSDDPQRAHFKNAIFMFLLFVGSLTGAARAGGMGTASHESPTPGEGWFWGNFLPAQSPWQPGRFFSHSFPS